jgi:hypothetical protein
MEVINIQVPNDPHTEATRTQVRIWEKKVYDYVTRCTVLEQNIKSTHFLIWGQCSDLMQQKVEASEGFDCITKRCDAIELLKIIKDIAYNLQTQKYTPHALHEAKRQFYNCHHACNQTT